MNAPAVPRQRLRDLGLVVGDLEVGLHNAITDVPGVRVGHSTLVRPGIRTGVTAVLPHDGNLRLRPAPSAVFVGNGYGKLTGLAQVHELGQLETPLLLTGTLSTFRVADALVEWVLEQPGCEQVRSVNPVVAETNDGWWRRDGHGAAAGREQVRQALASAAQGSVAEGCVGAGTGTIAFGFKAGIGTSSRRLEMAGDSFTVGVLVQANHGGRLSVLGAPVGRLLTGVEPPTEGRQDGSVVVVAATDAPLDARQLGRLARRAVLSLARTGAAFAGGSGDYAIAFAAPELEDRGPLADDALEPLWLGTQDAVDEAVLNSLTMAHAVEEGGLTAPELPLDRLVELCARYRLP